MNIKPIIMHICNRNQRQDRHPDNQAILRDVMRHRRDLEVTTPEKIAQLKEANGLILFKLEGTVRTEHLCQAGTGPWVYHNGNMIRGTVRASKTIGEALQFLADIEQALAGVHTDLTERFQAMGWFAGEEATNWTAKEDAAQQHARGRQVARTRQAAAPVQPVEPELPADIQAEIEAGTEKAQAEIDASLAEIERLQAAETAMLATCASAEQALKARKIHREVVDTLRRDFHRATQAVCAAKSAHKVLVNRLTLGQVAASHQ